VTNAGRRREITGRTAPMASAASSQAGSALSLLSTPGGGVWVAIAGHLAGPRVMLLCGSLRWRWIAVRALAWPAVQEQRRPRWLSRLTLQQPRRGRHRPH